MCALAGAEYDGAFFNWMTPGFRRRRPRAGRGRRGRGGQRAAAGLRLRPHRRRRQDAAERLAKEESFYRDLHHGYRNHFDRLGEPEGTVGVAAATRPRPRPQLATYEALDTIVVRGLASANLEAMTAVAEAAAPQ